MASNPEGATNFAKSLLEAMNPGIVIVIASMIQQPQSQPQKPWERCLMWNMTPMYSVGQLLTFVLDQGQNGVPLIDINQAIVCLGNY